MRKIRCVSDGVLIRRNKEDEKTKGGIIVPEKARRQSGSGVVISVGPGTWTKTGERILPDVKVGDTVFFCWYWVDADLDAKIDYLEKENGEEIIFIHENWILGKLEETHG